MNSNNDNASPAKVPQTLRYYHHLNPKYLKQKSTFRPRCKFGGTGGPIPYTLHVFSPESGLLGVGLILRDKGYTPCERTTTWTPASSKRPISTLRYTITPRIGVRFT